MQQVLNWHILTNSLCNPTKSRKVAGNRTCTILFYTKSGGYIHKKKKITQYREKNLSEKIFKKALQSCVNVVYY